MKLKLTIFFIFFTFTTVFCEKIIVLNSIENYKLDDYIYVYAEKKDIKDIDYIIENKAIIFEKGKTNYGLMSDALWLKINIKNNIPEMQEWLLNINYPLLGEMELFLFSDDKLILNQNFNIFNDRKTRSFTTRFDLNPNNYYTLYLRIETPGTMRFPLALYPLNNYFHSETFVNLLYGLYFGFILSLAFFSLFISLSYKKNMYTALSIFMIFHFFFEFVQSGFFFRYFPEIESIYKLYVFLGFAPLITLSIFSQKFLKAQEYSKIGSKLFKYFYILSTVILLLIFFVTPSTSIFLYSLIGIFFVIPNLYCSLIALKKNDTPSKIFFIGIAFLIFSILIFSLRGIGFFPSNFFTLYIKEIGNLTLILSLIPAIWYKIKEYMKISERTRELEKEKIIAEKTAKEKSEFLANMSHEIRTPINAISGLTNLVLNTDLNSTQSEYLNKIKISSKHLLNIVNDILDFSKIEAGKIILENEEFCLKNIVENIKSFFSFQLKEKNLDLELIVDENMPECLIGDSFRINQILINLIGNAVKFTNKGKITVSIENLENDISNDSVLLKFSVKDTGIGIKEESKEKLFQSFTQADSSITKKYGGTGLGLMICKKLVEFMRGTINFESEYGKGSCFYFSIPLKKGEEKKTFDSQQPIENTNNIFKGYKILLADDIKINQLISKEVLTNMGFEVIIANNGKEAVQLTDDTIDLILMDIQMPEMNGFEATAIIKNKFKNIPILAITAGLTIEENDDFINSGMDDFILKPIDKDNIAKKLCKWLK